MAVLAHSDAAGIASRLEAIAVPVYENLREPENGLVMVRGRIGGDGAPFNLGEATSHAPPFGFRARGGLRLHAWPRSAEGAMIALCDALVQSDEFADAVESKVIAPLRTQMISERSERLRKPRRRGSISTRWCAVRAER